MAVPNDCKLFVGNLPYSCKQHDLADMFRGYGSIIGSKIVEDRNTGKSKGFGFVTFDSAVAAEDAVHAISTRGGLVISGRIITVRSATARGTGPVTAADPEAAEIRSSGKPGGRGSQGWGRWAMPEEDRKRSQPRANGTRASRNAAESRPKPTACVATTALGDSGAPPVGEVGDGAEVLEAVSGAADFHARMSNPAALAAEFGEFESLATDPSARLAAEAEAAGLSALMQSWNASDTSAAPATTTRADKNEHAGEPPGDEAAVDANDFHARMKDPSMLAAEFGEFESLAASASERAAAESRAAGLCALVQSWRH